MKINQTELINATLEFLKQKGLSQNDLSARMGCSSSVISQLLNNSYSGDSRYYLMQMASVIDYEPEGTKWQFVRSGNVEAMKDLYLEAQEDCRTVCVIANTGMSKTRTIKSFMKDNPSAFYVLADINMKKKDFIDAILTSLGIYEAGSLSEKINAIVKFLIGCNYPILFIDDCGKFEVGTKANFYQLLLLMDKLKNYCAIALTGTPRFKKFLEIMCAKDVAGFREIVRRIEYTLTVGGMERKFVETVCKKYGITDEYSISLISNRCNNYGDVENMLNAYDRAVLKNEGVVKPIFLLENLLVK